MSRSGDRVRAALARSLKAAGWTVVKPARVGNVPDSEGYGIVTSGAPVYRPWVGDETIASVKDRLKAERLSTLVDDSRLAIICNCLAQVASVDGEIWEVGVYQGGVALLLKLLRDQLGIEAPIRLFDTFAGLPSPDEHHDLHHEGDFADTSPETVRRLVGSDTSIHIIRGLIPETFRRLESAAIRVAHIDVDLYQSTADACSFIYPRMSSGGVMVLDDYGLHSCPGVRAAVDAFFRDKPEAPIVLTTGQALVFKLGANPVQSA